MAMVWTPHFGALRTTKWRHSLWRKCKTMLKWPLSHAGLFDTYKNKVNPMRRISSFVSSMVMAFVFTLTLSAGSANAASFSATFINPGKSSEKFWLSVSDFMTAAAKSLDIKLEILYAERDHLKAIELSRSVAQRATKPDYLIVVNEKQAAGEMIKIADKLGLKTFLLLNKFEDEQAVEFGAPRQKYKHWIGTLTPDNQDAGTLTAAALIKQARQAKLPTVDGKLQMIAIGGDKSTPASVQRLAGVQKALAKSSDVQLTQTVYGNWEQERAREQVAQLLQRYPQTRAIWAANDLMAFGAMEAAKASGRKVGEDIFFSGINNSPEALAALGDGRLAALGAGHFMAGGWALVMLYDYHKGRDFASEGLELRGRMFGLVERKGLERFNARMADTSFGSFDFRRYSKVLQPGLKTYPFDMTQLTR